MISAAPQEVDIDAVVGFQAAYLIAKIINSLSVAVGNRHREAGGGPHGAPGARMGSSAATTPNPCGAVRCVGREG
jgi:hypothetical protein